MKREALKYLEDWKYKDNRKPLIIMGPRQVGKSWLINEDFSKSFSSFIKIDFDEEQEFKQLFETSKNPERLIENISLAKNKRICDGTTLLFLDEIQECPEALNSLKYFYEQKPNLHVIAAGSLLGLQSKEGFPVGKVEFMDLGPMNFREFLVACGDENLAKFISEYDTLDNIPDIFSGPLLDKLKLYFIVGGMPEPIKIWLKENDFDLLNTSKQNILNSYRGDFGKHSPSSDLSKINLVWDSLPAQLSKENKKFLYSVVKNGARAREYENALYWLRNARLLNWVSKITKPGIPISSYEERTSFKIYMSDVGLLAAHANLPSHVFNVNTGLFSEFKGGFIENYCIQSLLNGNNEKMYYWADNKYEVDATIQYSDYVFPIEMKAGFSKNKTSLKQYMDKYGKDVPFAIRYSMRDLKLDGKILNIPLFMVSETDRLVDIALSNL